MESADVYNGRISRFDTPIAHRIVSRFQLEAESLNSQNEINLAEAIDFIQKRQVAIIEAIAELEMKIGRTTGLGRGVHLPGA